MSSEFNTPVDIREWPAAAREAAEEVQRTKRPRLIKRGDEAISILSPVVEPSPANAQSRRKGKTLTNRQWLRQITDVGRSYGPTDISSNPDKYLAQANRAESHPSER
jgi:hypothetical protein